jgi:hypothetical protein
MQPEGPFLRVFRLVWLGVNIASLIVSVSGLRDLSGIILMPSFPASVPAGLILMIAFDATGWSVTSLVTLLMGTIVILSGYIQWFVMGRVVAERILLQFPARRLLPIALRAGIVFVFVSLGAIGVEMARAQEQARLFFERAMAVREGMTIEEVRSILGDPKQVFELTETPSVCSAGAVRGASYWYEHRSLPRRLGRDSFVLIVCSDPHGKVVHIATGQVH